MIIPYLYTTQPRGGGGGVTALLVYVDDITVTDNDMEGMETLKGV